MWRLNERGGAFVSCRQRPAANGKLVGWPRSTVDPVTIGGRGRMHALHCDHSAMGTLVRLEAGCAVAILWGFGAAVSDAQASEAEKGYRVK